MEESSNSFLGTFEHCTLCNSVVYGRHGLLLTMFYIVCVFNNSGVTWNGYLCTLLILAVDKGVSISSHMFIEVLIAVDSFMAVSMAPSRNVLQSSPNYCCMLVVGIVLPAAITCLVL